MKQLRSQLFLAIALGSISCGSKDSNEKGQQSLSDRVAGNAFLTASDMEAPAGMQPMSAERAKLAADSWSLFSPNSTGLTALATLNASSSCFEQIFGDLAGATYSASGPILSLSFEKTLENCNFEGDAKGKVTLKSVMALSCDGADFTPVAGKKSGDTDIPQETICKNSSEMAVIHNFHVTFEWTQNGQTFKSVQKSGMMGTDGKACVWKRNGDKLTNTGCADFDVTTSPEGVEYKKAVYENVTDSLSQKTQYHTSGKMKLTLNNWAGEATFPGPSTPPVWTLTNGTQTINNGAAGLR